MLFRSAKKNWLGDKGTALKKKLAVKKLNFIIKKKLRELGYYLALIFFEKKFASLIGYDENIDNTLSESTLLDLHLSHRTISNFKFELYRVIRYLTALIFLSSITFGLIENYPFIPDVK